MTGSTISVFYPRPAYDNTGTPLADQRLTVSTGVVQLTAFAEHTDVIVLDIQDQDVMVTFDGSSPSSSNGHHLIAGEKYTWRKATAEAAKFIRQGSSDGVVHASQFKV